jgi:cell division protein FtsA
MIGGSTVLAGLDIGSTQTRAVIAEARLRQESPELLDIIGVGAVPSQGMKGATITHLEAATRSVRRAIQQAEVMAGREVESIYVGVPGPHVEISRSRGVVAVSGAEITPGHVKRVQEVGQAVPVPRDRDLIHAICQEYAVDGRDGIQDPVGMVATRLESEVCIVTAESTVCRDLSKAVDRAGYRPEELIMSPLASGMAVLADVDREAGVALVDLGGASTDLLVYVNRRLRHVASVPWGSASVTRDIARGLGVPEEEASRLKARYGVARRRAVDPKEQLEVSGASLGSNRRVSRELLAHIIEQRLDEVLGLIYEELEREELLDRLGAGVVLTGCGAGLPETEALARSVFNLPVRLGVPGRGLSGKTDALREAAFTASAGLALFGNLRRQSGGWTGATRTLSRVGEWLRDFF